MLTDCAGMIEWEKSVLGGRRDRRVLDELSSLILYRSGAEPSIPSCTMVSLTDLMDSTNLLLDIPVMSDASAHSSVKIGSGDNLVNADMLWYYLPCILLASSEEGLPYGVECSS